MPRNVSVIPVEIGWSDIGSWAALLDVLPGDERGNVCVDGELLALDTHGVLGAQRRPAGCGDRPEGLVIVDTPDVLLVCPRARAQDVRDLVNRLAAEGKPNILRPGDWDASSPGHEIERVHD